jgi:flagellar hook-associated protein 2
MVGTVSQVGTRVFVGGTASNIDTNALIDAAVQQKNIRADRLQIEIDENVNQINAYSELETLAANIKTSLDALKGNPSIFDENDSVFDLKSGTVLTSDGSDFSSIADIVIDKEAVPGTYDIEVIQAAQAQQVIGTNATLNPDGDKNYNGSFSIGLSGGASSNITVTNDMSLNEIAAAINTTTNVSGVAAAVIKTSENEYQLLLSGQEENQTIVIGNVTGTSVMFQLGVTDGAGGFNSELQVPQSAIIEFDNVTITRDDNNFDDLIDGIAINVRNEAPGTILSLEVGNDTSGVKDAILNFIEAYNAFRDFVSQNQQISANGVVNENAALFGDGLLSGLSAQYADILGQNFGNGGDIQTIRDLGITIGNEGKLVLSDEAVLDNALLNNFEEVQAAFASSSQSDDSNFAMLGNTSSLSSQSIVFNITMSGGNITGVSANGTSNLFDISGTSIIGKKGSIYEGLRFSFQGSSSTTVNFELGQGLADRLINSVVGYTNSIDGLIIQEKAGLQQENTNKAEDIREIRDRSEAFRERQIEKYAEFEARLQQLETLRDQIRAILGTDDDN